MSASTDTHKAGEGEEPTRRDFIHILAGSVAAVGAAGTLVPLVDQMNPDASVLALSTKEVDLSNLPVGQAIKVMWQGKPVFIRHRTEEEIREAENVQLSQLKDEKARNDNLPSNADAEDKNRVINPAYMVVVGVCTHLGCIPLGTAQGETRGEYGGWFCPCHGSVYDTSGRIRKGPAPENLLVPPYEFLTDTTIKIG
ncbi:MAG: ubiquinol-cytochrome c reductase iron-sulfur subunit [Pseudomonadota bacterium]|nr:ubiquinol-cytochrome c reductase iron-sulfur subunit [Pseudomonadota bacterium]